MNKVGRVVTLASAACVPFVAATAPQEGREESMERISDLLRMIESMRGAEGDHSEGQASKATFARGGVWRSSDDNLSDEERNALEMLLNDVPYSRGEYSSDEMYTDEEDSERSSVDYEQSQDSMTEEDEILNGLFSRIADSHSNRSESRKGREQDAVEERVPEDMIAPLSLGLVLTLLGRSRAAEKLAYDEEEDSIREERDMIPRRIWFAGDKKEGKEPLMKYAPRAMQRADSEETAEDNDPWTQGEFYDEPDVPEGMEDFGEDFGELRFSAQSPKHKDEISIVSSAFKTVESGVKMFLGYVMGSNDNVHGLPTED